MKTLATIAVTAGLLGGILQFITVSRTARADTSEVVAAVQTPVCPDIIPAEMLSASEIDVGTKLCKFMKSELMTIGRVRGRVDVTCQDGKVFMIGGSVK